jgi:hypothetical protein
VFASKLCCGCGQKKWLFLDEVFICLYCTAVKYYSIYVWPTRLRATVSNSTRVVVETTLFICLFCTRPQLMHDGSRRHSLLGFETCYGCGQKKLVSYLLLDWPTRLERLFLPIRTRDFICLFSFFKALFQFLPDPTTLSNNLYLSVLQVKYSILLTFGRLVSSDCFYRLGPES